MSFSIYRPRIDPGERLVRHYEQLEKYIKYNCPQLKANSCLSLHYAHYQDATTFSYQMRAVAERSKTPLSVKQLDSIRFCCLNIFASARQLQPRQAEKYLTRLRIQTIKNIIEGLNRQETATLYKTLVKILRYKYLRVHTGHYYNQFPLNFPIGSIETLKLLFSTRDVSHSDALKLLRITHPDILASDACDQLLKSFNFPVNFSLEALFQIPSHLLQDWEKEAVE